MKLLKYKCNSRGNSTCGKKVAINLIYSKTFNLCMQEPADKAFPRKFFKGFLPSKLWESMYLAITGLRNSMK